jgi:hypothetical protein
MLLEYSMLDHDEYVVESVLDHGYDDGIRQRRHLKLLIKWAGFPKEEATWEYYSKVRNASVVEEYILSKGL